MCNSSKSCKGNCKCKSSGLPKGSCKNKSDKQVSPQLKTDKTNYYLGIADITVYKVKCTDCDIQKTRYYTKTAKHPYDIRRFSGKFQKSPLLAILYAVNGKGEMYSNTARKEFFKKLTYNKENNCYYYTEYLTTGTHKPAKPNHMELFYKGEYELLMVRYEIQALKTEVTSIPEEIFKFSKQTGMIVNPDQIVSLTTDSQSNGLYEIQQLSFNINEG